MTSLRPRWPLVVGELVEKSNLLLKCLLLQNGDLNDFHLKTRVPRCPSDSHSEGPTLSYGVLNGYQTLSHEEIVEYMETSTLEFCETVTRSQWVCVFTLAALD